MKWIKHESDDRNKLPSKLIRTRFGIKGYGIYWALKEVVAEYVKDDNIDKWGHVDPMHDIDSLAVECSITPEELKEFLAYCDEKKIFEKDELGLYDPLILERLDTFFTRIKNSKKPTSKSLRTKSKVKTHIDKEKDIDKEEDKKEKRIEITHKYSSLNEITSQVLQELAEEKRISLKDVQITFEQMKDWLQAKNKRYSNYKAGLRNWINKKLEEGKIKKVLMQPTPNYQPAEPISEEERQRNLERSQKMREQLKTKFSFIK